MTRAPLGGGQSFDGPVDGRIGRVITLDAGGLGVSPRVVGRTRFEQAEVPREILDRNDNLREQRQANLRAGLSETGMATYQTSKGQGVYDPLDDSEIARVRKVIAAEDGPEAAEAWQPYAPPSVPADEPDDPDAIRCHVCSDPFPNRARLARHVEIHHPDAEAPPPPPEPEPVLDPELSSEDLREVYADDPYVSERETPPWLRDT